MVLQALSDEDITSEETWRESRPAVAPVLRAGSWVFARCFAGCYRAERVRGRIIGLQPNQNRCAKIGATPLNRRTRIGFWWCDRFMTLPIPSISLIRSLKQHVGQLSRQAKAEVRGAALPACPLV